MKKECARTPGLIAFFIGKEKDGTILIYQNSDLHNLESLASDAEISYFQFIPMHLARLSNYQPD